MRVKSKLTVRGKEKRLLKQGSNKKLKLKIMQELL